MERKIGGAAADVHTKNIANYITLSRIAFAVASLEELIIMPLSKEMVSK